MKPLQYNDEFCFGMLSGAGGVQGHTVSSSEQMVTRRIELVFVVQNVAFALTMIELMKQFARYTSPGFKDTEPCQYRDTLPKQCMVLLISWVLDQSTYLFRTHGSGEQLELRESFVSVYRQTKKYLTAASSHDFLIMDQVQRLKSRSRQNDGEHDAVRGTALGPYLESYPCHELRTSLAGLHSRLICKFPTRDVVASLVPTKSWDSLAGFATV